jgi:hypothetical protein
VIWPWRKKRTPQERLAASEGDEVEYCRTVCELADEARGLLRWGRNKRALELLRIIADLDIDEKTISPVVEHARHVLESRGLAPQPSVAKEYQAYLDGLPPHQRYLVLARECIRQLGSRQDPASAAETRRRAVAYFEQANEHGPLGRRDQRIYLALKQGEQPVVGAPIA